MSSWLSASAVVLSLYEPSAHSWQASSSFEPSWSLNLPRPQILQDSISECSDADIPLSSRYVPFGQLLQELATFAPSIVPYFPSLQIVQSSILSCCKTFPSSLLNLPFGHFLHWLAPCKSRYVPAVHTIQSPSLS